MSTSNYLSLNDISQLFLKDDIYVAKKLVESLLNKVLPEFAGRHASEISMTIWEQMLSLKDFRVHLNHVDIETYDKYIDLMNAILSRENIPYTMKIDRGFRLIDFVCNIQTDSFDVKNLPQKKISDLTTTTGIVTNSSSTLDIFRKFAIN
jgi:DNA replicative helicase MCM subunit Mcm2 (Cdc46/Mcm family)